MSADRHAALVQAEIAAAGNTSHPTTQTAPASDTAPQPTQAPGLSRQIIYTGSMTLTTPDAEDAMRRIQADAVALGGFLGKWEGSTITIRAPAGKLNEAIERIARLGSISDKQLDALDVTDQLRDIEARLKNAEAMRQRLIALLERSGKMEELLKVEKELQRVTEEIERMKAQLVAMREHVAFSSLTVHIIEAQPRLRPTYTANLPFSWINHIGTEIRTGQSFTRANRKFGKGVGVELPKGFVRFWQENHTTVAMSSRQVVVKVSRHRNFDDAKADFWADLIEDHFKRSDLVEVGQRDTLFIRDNKPAIVIHGAKAFGQGDYGYLIATATSTDYVYTYEAWGPISNFKAALPQLEASIQTLKASSGW